MVGTRKKTDSLVVLRAPRHTRVVDEDVDLGLLRLDHVRERVASRLRLFPSGFPMSGHGMCARREGETYREISDDPVAAPRALLVQRVRNLAQSPLLARRDVHLGAILHVRGREHCADAGAAACYHRCSCRAEEMCHGVGQYATPAGPHVQVYAPTFPFTLKSDGTARSTAEG